MKLKMLNEAKFFKITGGAISPPAVYPHDFPHEIIDAPDIWYHGTTDKHLDFILKNGLNKGTHITQDRKLANFSGHRAVHRWGGKPITLILSLKDLDLTILGTKLDSRVDKEIPPSAITKVHNIRSKNPNIWGKRGDPTMLKIGK